MSLIEKLLKRSGNYQGQGKNHEGEKFVGKLSLKPVLNDKGVELSYIATGESGEVFHQEKTMIGPSELGGYSLWTINSNVPFQYEHKHIETSAPEEAAGSWTFLHNQPEDSEKFREAISLDYWEDGDISYRFSWGLPGEDYGERSAARMSKSSQVRGRIDHVTLRVKDLGVSREFYLKAFAPLGWGIAFENEKVFSAFDLGDGYLFEIAQADQSDSLTGTHVAFRMESEEQVRAFYAAAMEAGAKDNGAPGPRPAYTENYYAAFVHDPSGHNMEAMFDKGNSF